MKHFKMEKICEDRDLIWYMVGDMVKKQDRGRLYISCNYACTLYLLVKLLSFKSKDLDISTCLKLNYDTTKQKTKENKGCKDDRIYENL